MVVQNVPNSIHRGVNKARLHRKTLSDAGNSVSSAPIPPPRGVQSMLKSTTELGDAGPLPRSMPRSSDSLPRLHSTRQRSGSIDSSFASALHHYRSPRDRPGRPRHRTYRPKSGLALTRYDSVQSNLTSYLYAPRSRRVRLKVQHPYLQGLTSPRIPSRPLHNHRSLITLRSYENRRSKYSDSTSGSLFTAEDGPYRGSHVNRTRYRQPVPAHIGNRSSATSSPASVASRAGITLYGARTDNSILSLNRRPSPALSNKYFPSRGALRALRERSEVGSIDRLSNGPRTPRYYDYSESFIEEEPLAPTSDNSMQVPFPIRNQPIAYQHISTQNNRAQTPFGMRLGSKFFPAELPSTYNHDADVIPVTAAQAVAAGQSLDALSVSPKLGFAELDGGVVNQQAPKLAVDKAVDLNPPTHPSMITTNHACELPLSAVHSSKELKSQRDPTASGTQVHFPDVGVPCDPKSEPQVSSSTITRPRKTPLRPLSIHIPKIPLMLSVCRDDQFLDSAARPKTSPVTVYAHVSEIVSPQPERPVSSQSRKYFRRIIEVGENPEALRLELSRRGAISTCLGPTLLSDVATPGCLDEINRTEESLPEHEHSPQHALKVDGAQTPKRYTHISVATSNEESTVDLLLDKHIEALGLMPEPDTLSEPAVQLRLSPSSTRYISERGSDSAQDLLDVASGEQIWPSTTDSGGASSLNSDARIRLRPQRLFASLNDRIFIAGDPKDVSSDLKRVVLPDGVDFRSYGWQSLPSSISKNHDQVSNRPTVASGEMGDIDTDVHSLGHKVRRSSQLSLPTSLGEWTVNNPSKHTESGHRRSRSEVTTKQEARRRKRLGVRITQQNHFGTLKIMSTSTRNNKASASAATIPHRPVSSIDGYAELDSNQPTTWPRRSNNHQSTMHIARAPQQTASDPLGTAMIDMSTRNPSKKLSARTHRSQRSQYSQGSLAEPLNSTRQRSQRPRLDSRIPRLAPPDLGPPLDASTLNLSIPYAETPSTILSSFCGNKSYFEDSPPRARMSRRGTRRQFGLRPLRTATQRSRATSTPIKVGLPTRNGIPIAAVSPFSPAFAGQCTPGMKTMTVPEPMLAPSFSERKKGVIDKFKCWWRSHCMQKAFAARRKRVMQSAPGGMLV